LEKSRFKKEPSSKNQISRTLLAAGKQDPLFDPNWNLELEIWDL